MPRAFLYTLAGVNVVLAAAGAAYAARFHLSPALAAPIVAAFLLQFSFYLVPAIPEGRLWLERRAGMRGLGGVAAGTALAAYLVYSVPTGVFQVASLGLVAVVAAAPILLFLVFPVRRPGLAWQDAALLAFIGVVELGGWYRRIYISPLESLSIDFLGRVMLIGVAATAWLSLRRLEGCGFQLWAPLAAWKTGGLQAACFLPLGMLAGSAIGTGRFRPMPIDLWLYPGAAVGIFVGIYAVVALFEEMLFRGVLQNLLAVSLGRPRVAQGVASVVYGMAHLTFARQFPNWRFVLLSTLAGWFYGEAYRRGGSIVPAALAHALVVTVWRLWFTA